MKRMRNAVIATAALVTVFFLFLQQQEQFPKAYRFRRPHVHIEWDEEDGSGTATETTPSRNSDNEAFDKHAPSAIPSGLGAEAPEIASPNGPAESSSVASSPTPFEAEFPFQKDLQLDLPIETFLHFTQNQAHNYNPNALDSKNNYAYATFMATHNPSLKDPYYMAIHSLIYRVLWSPRSRTTQHPFIVFVADFVTQEQRDGLAGAGAIVRELAPLEWNPNVEGVQHRWKDLFAKLNMWNETDFDRILFLDADAFPVANIDEMFEIAPTRNCKEGRLALDDLLEEDFSAVCEDYVFAGVPQDPFNETDININVGAMVFTPSSRMHRRLLQNYVKTDRYNCMMAEQAFLNWMFNINGAFPGTELERKWGGFFPNEGDEGKLNVVHEKIWSETRKWLREEWDTEWKAMLEFYASSEFGEARSADGILGR